MKAVVLESFGSADRMALGDVPAPTPQPDEILIEVRASAVNRPDLIQREGRYPPPPGESGILGLECAGRVSDAGPAVEEFAIGDRVFALLGGGGYAELATAAAGHAIPIPAGFSFEQAACIAETYITAWLNVFRIGELENGESVLLHGGGGGVNTAAIQLVKALAPDSPIFVTASEAKIDRVAALGADRIVDYRTQDFAAEIGNATEGRGVDVILDHIGAAYLDANLRSLAVGGRLVVIGIMQGSDAPISLGRLMLKRQRVIGSVLRPRPRTEKTAIIADFRKSVMPLFERGQIAPVIDSVFALDRIVEAHKRMEASRHFGKIAIRVSEDQE